MAGEDELPPADNNPPEDPKETKGPSEGDGASPEKCPTVQDRSLAARCCLGFAWSLACIIAMPFLLALGAVAIAVWLILAPCKCCCPCFAPCLGGLTDLMWALARLPLRFIRWLCGYSAEDDQQQTEAGSENKPVKDGGQTNYGSGAGEQKDVEKGKAEE